MTTDNANFLRTAFNSYLEQLESCLEPTSCYLPYEFDFIHQRSWYIFGREMVNDELREITNSMNQWHRDLRKWHAWNKVIAKYQESDAWNLRTEFLEATIHQCLVTPSAIRDRFTFVATNSLHQVRLSSEKNYKDYLEGDPKSSKQKPTQLRRQQKEKRLTKVSSILPNSKIFLESLQLINDEKYAKETLDFRNRSTHSIPPRLGIGFTRAITRTVKPTTEMKKQSNNTYKEAPRPGEFNVCYGCGGTPPLNLEEVRLSNLQQYHVSRECYQHYITLLRLGVEALPPKEQNT